MNELALFAGAGGGILGGKLLGWRTVCAVEWEPYPASVLCARQNDGLLETFPIWDDVQTFDGNPWRGIVDVVSGGFPCQDISAAGNGDGLDGERSGMWHQMARVVGEVRPRFVFVENSPMLTSRGGTRVIGDLTKMGYDCRWTVMGASNVGAPHKRDRLWIVAHARNDRFQRRRVKHNSLSESILCKNQPNDRHKIWSEAIGRVSIDDWREYAASFCGMDDGMAARVDRLKAIGNGQVPLCAATAWRILSAPRS